MLIKPLILIFLTLVCVTTGCGTLASRWNYDPYEHKEYLNPSHLKDITSRVYSGLGWHFNALRHCYGPYKISDSCGFSRDLGYKTIWWMGVEVLAGFDYLFLSTAADTVILPVTIFETCCTGALSNAAAQGDLELVQQLLAAGADVNNTDSWGHTPLISACWAGHKDIVQVLLERGADVKATTPRGWTALRFATKLGHPEMVELLKAAGAEG
jgi:uncharacterized protein YceK